MSDNAIPKAVQILIDDEGNLLDMMIEGQDVQRVVSFEVSDYMGGLRFIVQTADIVKTVRREDVSVITVVKEKQ